MKEEVCEGWLVVQTLFITVLMGILGYRRPGHACRGACCVSYGRRPDSSGEEEQDS